MDGIRRGTFLAILVLATPASGQSNEDILKRLDAIEKRLDKLESAPSLGAIMNKVLETGQEQAQSGAKADMGDPPQPKFEVTLLDAKPDGEDVLGKSLVRIVASVKNETGRDAALDKRTHRF